MKNFAVKMIMPVAAFMLASAGAVSTSSAVSKSTGAAVQGWQYTAPTQCTELRMCNNIGTTICTLSGVQAFGKVGNECQTVLYQKN